MEKKAIIITAPSGAGKTTITNHLLKRYDQLSFSISATTRGIRKDEKEGEDYYFLEKEDFENRIKKDGFVEWEEVYNGLYYGTLKSELHRIWEQGKVVVFVVDVIGAMALEQYFENSALSIFIFPPSKEILIERLKKRGTENSDILKQRLRKVDLEMKYANKFDHIIVNGDLSDAFNAAERLVERYING